MNKVKVKIIDKAENIVEIRNAKLKFHNLTPEGASRGYNLHFEFDPSDPADKAALDVLNEAWDLALGGKQRFKKHFPLGDGQQKNSDKQNKDSQPYEPNFMYFLAKTRKVEGKHEKPSIWGTDEATGKVKELNDAEVHMLTNKKRITGSTAVRLKYYNYDGSPTATAKYTVFRIETSEAYVAQAEEAVPFDVLGLGNEDMENAQFNDAPPLEEDDQPF